MAPTSSLGMHRSTSQAQRQQPPKTALPLKVSPSNRQQQKGTCISHLPNEILFSIFRMVLRLGNPLSNEKVSGENERKNFLGLRGVCRLFKLVTGEVIQSEWKQIKKIAAHRFLFPRKMVRIENIPPQFPKKMITAHCDSQDVLFQMYWFKQLAQHTRASAEQRGLALEGGDVFFLAPRLENAIEEKALQDLGDALRKLYPQTFRAETPMEVRNWCLDPTHSRALAEATSLEITYSQILDLPIVISNLLVAKKQAINDHSLDVLCNSITTKYPEIVFPATPEEKRAWFYATESEEARQSITTLDLYQKNLELLPPEIGELSALKKLYLDDNKLETLPSEIGNLSALKGLYLENNKLESLPREIGNLSALKELYLNDNRLETLPPEIGKLSALQEFLIKDNKIESLPPEIGNLSALQELDLENNRIETLPPEIGNLSALKRLVLDNNKLKTVPSNIGKLSCLLFLYIQNNQLKTLPSEIGNLTALEQLHLENNKLKTLPSEIGNLLALNQLLLNNNKFQSIPPEIGNLSALDELQLENNQLKTLPREIGKLTRLSTLSFENNQLKTLPKEIGKLIRLECLFLCYNLLEALPSEIGNLSALTELYLDHNKIKILPPQIGALTALQKLNLGYNNLKTLPSEIGNLAALLQLYLAYNKLEALPVEIAESPNPVITRNPQIKRYFARMAETSIARSRPKRRREQGLSSVEEEPSKRRRGTE